MNSVSALYHTLYDLVQFCGLMQIGDSINTLSWSLMPGIGLQDKIKDGMLVINKSVRRVGEFTIWVRLWFARKSINIIITKFNWRVVASF